MRNWERLCKDAATARANKMEYWATISPAIAAQGLERNDHNRPLKPRRVGVLADLMRSGNFCLFNGDRLRVTAEGTLMDGQHRLHAIVEANTALRLEVVAIPDEAFRYLGFEKPRGGADVMSIQGEKSSALLAAAIGIVRRVRMGQPNYSHAVPPPLLCDTLEHERGLVEHVDWHNKLNVSERRICTPSIATAMRYLFAEKSPEDAVAFWDLVLKGGGGSADATTTLRNRLLQNAMAKAKLPTAYTMAIVIRAWNHFRRGSPCKALRQNAGDPFPEIE